MAKTMISCPNCRQSITAELEQLFDVGVDPSAKQRFLSGAINIIQCPFCRFQGIYPTPLVYHDPDKELLITFIPTEGGWLYLAVVIGFRLLTRADLDLILRHSPATAWAAKGPQ